MATVHLKDTEGAHKRLFDAHWKLAGGAEAVHNVATELYAAARHSDVRSDLVPVISKLEEARRLADEAWLATSEARNALIKLTGCSGGCGAK